MADGVIQWPLRDVSADPTNLTKLDADRNILTSTADVAAKFVLKAGDTMTGPLTVKAPQPAGTAGVVSLATVSAETGRAIARITNAGDSAMGPFLVLRKDRGTLAAPTAVKANDQLGQVRWIMADGTAERTAGAISVFAAADGIATGCDSFMTLSVLAANAATTATTVTLRNTAAGGRTFDVSADNFTVGSAGGVTAAGGNFTVDAAGTIRAAGGNFTVGSAGGVTAAGGNFTVDAAGYITSKDGVFVDRTRAGNGVLVEVSNVGSGQTGYGVQAVCTGTSPTSGSVAGVRGEAKGVCNVGVGVYGGATGVATSNYGLQAFASGGSLSNVGLYIGDDIVSAPANYAIESQSPAKSFFKGVLGLNWATPTRQLEVGGNTILRGNCEIVGNITSAGLAHSFAPFSIPSSSVIGNDARTISATNAAGSAGQMLWDDNFIYLRTTVGWKKVALTAI